jgi:pimeloyl-ACP methyl ester carboxylesterase
MPPQTIQTNGVRLHVVEAGPSDGRLVLLLHGFPEGWYGWRRQMPCLAAGGYRVWAPDLRGYGRSDKPRGVAAYALDVLAADVVGLISAAGQPSAVLVGHDWGGVVAWHVAAQVPQRVRRLVVLNAPHPAVMRAQLWRHLSQLRRSWYIFFFQLPWLPEILLRSRHWALLVRAMQQSSYPDTFTDHDFEQYRQAWAAPYAGTAMLHWYRAALRYTPRASATPRMPVPTLLIWGVQDRFLGPELAAASMEGCSEGRLVMLAEATHWVQHEEADRVNAMLVAFLQAGWCG